MINAKSFDRSANALHLNYINDDGDLLDAGEATVFSSNVYTSQLVRSHAVEFYEKSTQFLVSD